MDRKWMKKNQMKEMMMKRRRNKISTKREKTEEVDEKRLKKTNMFYLR
jgi:hypothetical protein